MSRRSTAELCQLVVGTFSPSVILRVAERTGRLREHGLSVVEVAVPSSPAQFRALLDGSLDAALTSPDNVLAYRFSPRNPLGITANVRIVSAVDRGLGLGVYARPEISSPDRLVGARVGVDVATSGFAFALSEVLASAGITRAQYRMVELGSTPRRLEALLRDECQATMLNAGSDLLAAAAGMRLLGSVADLPRPYLGTVLAAGDGDRDRVAELATVLAATGDEILAGRLDEVAVEAASDAMSLPRGLAEDYLDRLKDPRTGLVSGGAVDLDALRHVIDLRRTYHPVVVDEVDVLAGALEPAAGLLERRA